MTTPEPQKTGTVPERMAFEAMVGRRISDLRERAHLSQRELGERVEEFLGRKLHRQSISVMEQGGRGPTAAEMVALAEVLGVTAAYFLFPPAGVKEVALPGGKLLTREEMERVVIDPETRNVVPAAGEAIARIGNWLNEHIAGGVIELRELNMAYESIALGMKPLNDYGLRAREEYNEEQLQRLPKFPGEPGYEKEGSDGKSDDQGD